MRGKAQEGGIDFELLGPATKFASLFGALQGSRGKGDEDGQEELRPLRRHAVRKEHSVQEMWGMEARSLNLEKDWPGPENGSTGSSAKHSHSLQEAQKQRSGRYSTILELCVDRGIWSSNGPWPVGAAAR